MKILGSFIVNLSLIRLINFATSFLNDLFQSRKEQEIIDVLEPIRRDLIPHESENIVEILQVMAPHQIPLGVKLSIKCLFLG